jgi:hypothetical protein
MPVIVPCPKCPAKLSAPESASGKQIRCPKCGTVAEVPTFVAAEEVPVVDAALAQPKPRPKPVVRAEVEDDEAPPPKRRAERDEDDEDDPPRKKKRARDSDDDDDYPHDHRQRRGSRRRRGGSGGKIALYVVGGLLLLGGVGFGIWALVSKDGPLARKTPPPAGWKQYTDREGTFKAYFPKEPEMRSVPVPTRPIGGGPIDPDVNAFRPGTAYVVFGPDSPVYIEVIVYPARGKVPESMRRELRDLRPSSLGGMDVRKVQWLGYDCMEVTAPTGVVRSVFTDRAAISATIKGPNNARATKAEEDGFFDNFELTK